MEAIAALADNLYRNFILRDIVGKVVPGLIIEVGAWSAIVGQSPTDVVLSVEPRHGAVVAALFALAWTLGFLAQTVLDILKTVVAAVRWGPLKGREKWPKCLHTLCPSEDGWVRTVGRRTWLRDEVRRELERLTVVKEATGNLAAAFGIFELMGLWHVKDHTLLAGLLPGIAIVLLLVRHFDACRRELRLQKWFWEHPESPPRNLKGKDGDQAPETNA